MATLEWIGKEAVLHHHNEIPFHLLQASEELSFGDVSAGNLLVQGDNLKSLKALLPYYARQIKCVYIDPPYNTGNEKWTYNDAVNAPSTVIAAAAGAAAGTAAAMAGRQYDACLPAGATLRVTTSQQITIS